MSSPLGRALKMDALHSLVEFNSLKPVASPLDSLPGVFFHTESSTHTNKSSQHPEYLRQVVLEVINNIPIEATLIFTDGSKNEIGHTGSGVFVKHGRWEASLKLRNADYCSVFHSEMIAIDMALEFVLKHQLFGEIWILSDSRSVVQYLDNWRDVSDRKGLKTLCNSCVLHLHWIASHVNLKYNDIADSFAKEGTIMLQAYVEPLTLLELYSRRKAFVNIPRRHPPAHSWYRSEGPGATIHFKGDKKGQTALARLASGHLKTLRFSRGDKKFNICTKCNMTEATKQHLHDSVPWCMMIYLSDRISCWR
ncbi:hypothetical protein AVEN_72619-1 [Araneus ventricosus]|uniref:RNase H type-1 domain-containing protein n=1 Tax=Araneus ventricosus TaxID=182803 RepID=A0A4Y2TU82_ARAVE|nr:hypothetical protein AVEN_72619-1 [Araneus ventricosus]